MNAHKRKRSEDQEPRKYERQDFLIGLVKALAQGQTGEARLGSGNESAHGMEGQRNTRLRMGSPVSSTRGMENQERSRSYANMAGSHNRTASDSFHQEFRQTSPATGMDQGLIEQAVELIRGLARPTQAAPVMDKLQEGIQLLTQMAQQTGRR